MEDSYQIVQWILAAVFIGGAIWISVRYTNKRKGLKKWAESQGLNYQKREKRGEKSAGADRARAHRQHAVTLWQA